MSRVRIVGGSLRSRQIDVPDAMGLRPTPDRVRETLFNWLGQDLTGWRCLDLFAGSGALGIEAASRGAAEVVLLEFAAKVHAQLAKTLQELGPKNVRLQRADALKFLQDAVPRAQRFDLILLDPPYRMDWLARIEPCIAPLLAEGGRVYVEAEFALESFAGLQRIKSGKAGQVHYQLFAGDEACANE